MTSFLRPRSSHKVQWSKQWWPICWNPTLVSAINFPIFCSEAMGHSSQHRTWNKKYLESVTTICYLSSKHNQEQTVMYSDCTQVHNSQCLVHKNSGHIDNTTLSSLEVHCDITQTIENRCYLVFKTIISWKQTQQGQKAPKTALLTLYGNLRINLPF